MVPSRFWPMAVRGGDALAPVTVGDLLHAVFDQGRPEGNAVPDVHLPDLIEGEGTTDQYSIAVQPD
jgi:hypothetical protein